jgi:hypothetical protein
VSEIPTKGIDPIIRKIGNPNTLKAVEKNSNVVGEKNFGFARSEASAYHKEFVTDARPRPKPRASVRRIS